MMLSFLTLARAKRPGFFRLDKLLTREVGPARAELLLQHLALRLDASGSACCHLQGLGTRVIV